VPNTPSNPLPSKYVIAKPETYDAFDLSAAKVSPVEVPKAVAIDSTQKATAQNTLPGQPKIETTRDLWSEAEKDAPKVKDKDKDKFEAPDQDSGGRAGTADDKPAMQEFAVSGETPSDQSITREKRAVWVVHGMGQQIPFETLDSLANGLLDVLPGQQVKPRLRTVKIALACRKKRGFSATC
jgi:hypothetical protein